MGVGTLEAFGLDRFNAAPAVQAREVLAACCSSRRWVELVEAGRPYPDAPSVLSSADEALDALGPADLDEALAGHPRIGERAGAHQSGSWSQQEQAGMAAADQATTEAMQRLNAEYEQRFGHVYLVCATGRSAQELLSYLRERLGNDPVTEGAIVRRELGRINRIRLARVLGEQAEASA